MNVENYTYPTKEFHIHHLTQLLQKDDLLVDIETTGFMAKSCQIYLIGIGFLSDETVNINLYFARTKEEESEILSEFINVVKDFNRIITFNGDMFDLPFIETRCQKYSLCSGIHNLISLDLFKIAKKYKRFLNLEHYTQKDIEHFLNIFREDKYSGGQLIDIYKKQALYPNDEEEQLLFLHNLEDVKGLVSLLSLLDFSVLENETPVVSDIIEDHKKLTFRANYSASLNLNFSILNEYGFFHLKENCLTGNFKLNEGKFKYYFPNYKDYYYVEDERLLLPKSLKHTVSKDRIRKAKKEECYLLTDPKALTKEKLGAYLQQIFKYA